MICEAMRLLIAILFYIFVDKHILSMLLNSKIHHRNFNGLCAWVCDDTTHTYMYQCLPTKCHTQITKIIIINITTAQDPQRITWRMVLSCIHPVTSCNLYNVISPLSGGQFYCVFRLVVATHVIRMCLCAKSINWEIVPNQAMQPLRHDSRKSLISIVPMRHNKVAVSKQFF